MNAVVSILSVWSGLAFFCVGALNVCKFVVMRSSRSVIERPVA